jgi:hypothetical protein
MVMYDLGTCMLFVLWCHAFAAVEGRSRSCSYALEKLWTKDFELYLEENRKRLITS